MALDRLGHGLAVAFPGDELAGGDVQEGDTVAFAFAADRSQPVVAATVHHSFGEGDTRRGHLGDAALHDGLGQFGIFQLVADGHAMAGPHQLRQVIVQGMVREACELDGARPVVALGEGDAEHGGSGDGVLQKSLIKIADTEQQEGVRVLRLDAHVLLHQGCFGGRGFGHRREVRNTVRAARNLIFSEWNADDAEGADPRGSEFSSDR